MDPASIITNVVSTAAKGIGWALNLKKEQLKRRIWNILRKAGGQGLDATGIHTEMLGSILSDVPLVAIWGEAENQWWLQIRNKWRVTTKLPTIRQIENALYEMSKDGTVRQLAGGRFTA